MQAQTHAWENALLSLAYEARQSDSTHGELQFESDLLEGAYHHCEAMTAIHSRSFYMASAMLPAEKRQATRALYAFCRVSDDIVDGAEGEQERRLREWGQRISSPHPPKSDLVAVAWADARRRFGVPVRYAEQLLDGVAADLHKVRYDTFEELAAYSYGVASTVGLMSMHIIGHDGEEAIPYAIKLGVALQITNILRDVAEDWQSGRVYLPSQEMALFGLGEEDLAEGQVTEKWRNFMRFQIARNRQLYAEAMPGIASLQPDGRFAIRAAAELYGGILDEIERNDYDVFSHRASLSKWAKMRRLPGIWARSRLAYRRAGG
ncbi:MAG: squalene/phytoene synthase family protein [Caldilineaceae bacterium]|nr:squalene/phytoene synthase family protein [Caldilineaceae bacterium]